MMLPVSDLFTVKYGVNLELNKLTPDPGGIAFVSRSDKNNGVSGRVKRLANVEPIPAGTLSVAGGGSVLATFLQIEPYYSGRDLYYLTPKQDFTTNELLFYAICIRENRYRYNYGRQANRTLKALQIPAREDVPRWVYKPDPRIYTDTDSSYLNQKVQLPDKSLWKAFKYSELFKIERGRGPRKKDLNGKGTTPFITSIDSKNGFANLTEMPAIHQGNTITVNRNGSVAEAFYQPEPFCSTEDVHVFNPKFSLTPALAMFLITLIKQEKYRYSYGRKWGIARMNESIIHLPVKSNGEPHWKLMEQYIMSLPYSSQIGSHEITEAV